MGSPSSSLFAASAIVADPTEMLEFSSQPVPVKIKSPGVLLEVLGVSPSVVLLNTSYSVFGNVTDVVVPSPFVNVKSLVTESISTPCK